MIKGSFEPLGTGLEGHYVVRLPWGLLQVKSASIQKPVS